MGALRVSGCRLGKRRPGKFAEENLQGTLLPEETRASSWAAHRGEDQEQFMGFTVERTGFVGELGF